MTECEDQSLGYAMYMLGQAGRVDPRRHLVLRTASNYSMPPRGASVVDSVLSGESTGTAVAADACWRIGAPVVHELVKGWAEYATRRRAIERVEPALRAGSSPHGGRAPP